MRGRLLSYQLVGGDGVALGGADLGAGQPNINASMVFADGVRMMQAAKWRDVVSVPGERCQGL